jgi:hypothetical protein
MKKIINATFLVVCLFILLNFLYSNMNPETLGLQMVFHFRIPGILTLRSVEMPLGFVLIAAFSAGIFFLACLQLVPIFFRNKDVRKQQKRIKELEKELLEKSQQAEVESHKRSFS